MHVPEIIEVKNVLSDLQTKGTISAWELPYENLLTRRSAAIFFFSADHKKLEKASAILAGFENFSLRANSEKKLSTLDYRVTFSKEEKEKNESQQLVKSS